MTDTTTTDPTGEYDPADDNVDGVLAHLSGADPAEVQRVLQAEQTGRGRVTILRALDAEQGETTTVELLHHWTDGDGTSHAPGESVTVPVTVAEQLTSAHYAKALDA